MRLPSPIITVFDLEYTAWECSMARHWLTPGEFREVVQIGAVKLDANSFARLDEFSLLIRQRINHQLSAYFQKLTGISQEAVTRQGVDFADAYHRFLDFAGDGPIASFGRDDRALMENLRLYGIADAVPLPVFYDLRGWFAVQGLDPRGLHSCDIAPALGLPFVGQSHNALDDARSLAAGMAVMAVRGGAKTRTPIRPAA
jgi:inhibitor of KinA sporulation pathway (predicted exonuclease)